jgi:osmotically-inducible protein OsmY
MTFLSKLGVETLILGGCLLLGAATPAGRTHQQPAPDNSKTNQRDQDTTAPTADQQKINPADREITKGVALHNDKALSTYAHNIKIITQDGKVTLKGPVRSDDERTAIVAKATAFAGEGNVSDRLEVAPPKS